MKRILVAIFITVFAVSGINAQKKWTLEECIKYALDNNIQIKRQELQTKITENNHKQSYMNMLPYVDAGANHSWNFGRNIDRFTNEIITSNTMSDNFSIQGSIVLFSGFQIINSIDQNKYLLEKSLKDLEKAKNDISLQIATVFLQILFNEENLEIAKSQLEVTSMQLDKTKRLVEVGSKPKSDLLQMQTQEANEKYNLTVAKNNLQISNLTLVQLLELDSLENFSIARPDSIYYNNENILYTVNQIYNEAAIKLPEIKSAEYSLKSSEKGLDIVRGDYLPKLNLSAGYYTGYSDARKKSVLTPGQETIGLVNNDPSLPVIADIINMETDNYPFFEQIKDNNSKAVSIGLTVPIFSKFQTRTNVSNAKLQVIDANYNMEQTKKTLYKEIQNAHSDAVSAFERFNSANEAAISNEESFKYIQQKFDVGLVSIFDYNLAKNDLLKAKSNYIQAKYEYIFKIKVLDFYRGLPIQL